MVNRSVSWSDWDTDLVTLEMQELKAMDFDLSLTGFDPMEIDDFLLSDVDPVEEDVTEPAQHAITRLADLWICGEHRVLCGDATSEDAVGHLVGSTIPKLMVTDPPYGVEYDPLWRERAGLGLQRQTGVVSNDNRV